MLRRFDVQGLKACEICGLKGVSQLEKLVDFVQQRVSCWYETSSQSSIPQGQRLTMEMPFALNAFEVSVQSS